MSIPSSYNVSTNSSVSSSNLVSANDQSVTRSMVMKELAKVITSVQELVLEQNKGDIMETVAGFNGSKTVYDENLDAANKHFKQSLFTAGGAGIGGVLSLGGASGLKFAREGLSHASYQSASKTKWNIIPGHQMRSDKRFLTSDIFSSEAKGHDIIENSGGMTGFEHAKQLRAKFKTDFGHHVDESAHIRTQSLIESRESLGQLAGLPFNSIAANVGKGASGDERSAKYADENISYFHTQEQNLNKARDDAYHLLNQIVTSLKDVNKEMNSAVALR